MALGGQIVSASDFPGAERLYTEYALSLPRRWRMAKSGSRDDLAAVNGRQCRQEHSKASRGDYSVEDSFAVMGATQASFIRTSPACGHSLSLCAFVYVVEPTVWPALTSRESASRKYRPYRSMGLDDALGLRRKTRPPSVVPPTLFHT